MKFLFVCPEKDRSFETDDFRIIENRGAAEDEKGEKYLDAKAELFSPCPFCGKFHIFHVRELACPFSPKEGERGGLP